MTAHQEAYSHFVMRDDSNDVKVLGQVSTGTLLERAYANEHSKMQRVVNRTTQRKEKKTGPRTPEQIYESITDRLNQVKELNESHLTQIDKITSDLNMIHMEERECETNTPNAAAKFRFYQELRGYVFDLIECFDEKLPIIVDLERRYGAAVAKYAAFLIERRRQDVRDQSFEMAQAQSTFN